MILLDARLFRLTKNETYRLQTRSLYGAIQALKLSDVPGALRVAVCGCFARRQDARGGDALQPELPRARR